MRIVKTKVYHIAEHPNKELVYTWIRDNWHDLNEYNLNEVIGSVKRLSELIGGDVNYSIGQVPDRGEFIRFTDYNEAALKELKAEDCPLTGVCWDISLIEGLKEGRPEKVLDELHSDTEYKYSDEGLLELCEANEYEFDENGKFFPK